MKREEKDLRAAVDVARIALIEAKSDLASYLMEVNDANSAAKEYQLLVPLVSREFGERSAQVADVLNEFGNALYEVEDLLAARGAYEKSLEIQSGLYGNDSPELFVTAANLASVYLKGDQGAMAEIHCRHLVRIAEASVAANGSGKEKETVRLHLADAYSHLGEALQKNAQFSESLGASRLAIALYQDLGAKPHDGLIRACRLECTALVEFSDLSDLGSISLLIGDLLSLYRVWDEREFLELAGHAQSTILGRCSAQELSESPKLEQTLEGLALLAAEGLDDSELPPEALARLREMLQLRRDRLSSVARTAEERLDSALADFVGAARDWTEGKVGAELLLQARQAPEAQGVVDAPVEEGTSPSEVGGDQRAHDFVRSLQRRFDRGDDEIEMDTGGCISELGHPTDERRTSTSKVAPSILRSCGDFLWENGIETEPNLRKASRLWHESERFRLRRRAKSWSNRGRETGSGGEAWGEREQTNHELVDAMVELGLMVAHADRVLRPEEEQLIRVHAAESLRRRGIGDFRINDLMRSRTTGRSAPVAVVADRLRDRLTTAQRGELLRHFFAVALADGDFAPEEESILKRLDQVLRPSPKLFSTLLREARKLGGRTRATKAMTRTAPSQDREQVVRVPSPKEDSRKVIIELLFGD